jgi:hypothetical protein
MTRLVLKRASASRSSGQWQDEDYDVLADGKAVGRIYEDAGAAAGRATSITAATFVYRHAHQLKLGSKALTMEMSAHLCWVGIRPAVTAANSLSASTPFSSLA